MRNASRYFGFLRFLYPLPDIAPYIGRFAREAHGDCRYRLERHNKRGKFFGSIMTDAKYSLLLVRDLPEYIRPLACISFLADEDGILTVVQIQGQRGKQEDLRRLRWERMLLQYVIDLARQCGYREVRVVSGTHNHWNDGRVNPAPEQFHLRYDVLPARMGFIVGDKYHTLLLAKA